MSPEMTSPWRAGRRARLRRPVASSVSSRSSLANDAPNAGQCSRSTACRSRSPKRAARCPQAPPLSRSVHASRVWMPRGSSGGTEVAITTCSQSPATDSVQPLPLRLVGHQPGAVHHPAAARVEHDHPDRGRRCGRRTTSGSPGARCVGAVRQVGEHRRRVALLADLAPRLVAGQFGRRQVAEVLVHPVALVGALDAPAPPRPGGDVAAPGGGGVPVVVHVVVVEDHRGRDDGEQPADRGVAPGLPVQGAVLLEVRDLAGPGAAGPGVAPLAVRRP